MPTYTSPWSGTVLNSLASAYPTETTTGTTLKRVTPEEEASAYQTAFGGLLDSNYGMVPESQLTSYFNLANPYMFGTGLEGINQQLAAAGFAPSGTGGTGQLAELASRLQASLGVQEAQALIQNATSGAQAQARAGLDIGQSRYGALTVPNVTSQQQTTKSGGSAVIPGTGWSSESSSSGGGGLSGSYAGGSASGGKGGTGGGGGGGSTPWWQTSYGEMNAGQGAAWNAEQGQKNPNASAYYGGPAGEGNYGGGYNWGADETPRAGGGYGESNIAQAASLGSGGDDDMVYGTKFGAFAMPMTRKKAVELGYGDYI